MKDKIYLSVIVGLLILGSISFIYMKRKNNRLILDQIEQAEKIKEQFKKEKDLLIKEYSNEIKNFQTENNSLNKINENLNIKIRKYEKNLSYNDRTFDTAVDVLSKAKYDSKSEK